jgi:hypothetical protein
VAVQYNGRILRMNAVPLKAVLNVRLCLWRHQVNYLSHRLMSLNPQQMSTALLCLAEQIEPPEDLYQLSTEDWILLGVLLESLMHEKELSVLH